MSAVELKSYVHELIDKINDNSILEAYAVLLAKEVNREEEDFWLTLDDKTKEAIESGLQNVNKSNTVNARTFMKEKYGV